MFWTRDRDRGEGSEGGDSLRWVVGGANRFAYFPFSNVNATHSVSGTRREGGRLMNVKCNEYNVLGQWENIGKLNQKPVLPKHLLRLS